MFSMDNLYTPDSLTNRSEVGTPSFSGLNTPSFSDLHSAASTPFFSKTTSGVNTPQVATTRMVKFEERMERLESIAENLAVNVKHLIKTMESFTGQPITPPSEDDLASMSGLSIDSQARLELLQEEDQRNHFSPVSSQNRRRSIDKKDLSETNEEELMNAIGESVRYAALPRKSPTQRLPSNKQLSPIESRCVSESLDMNHSLESGSVEMFITDSNGNVKRPVTPGSPPPARPTGLSPPSKEMKLNPQAEKFKYYIPPSPKPPSYYTVEERRLIAKQKHEREHQELVEQVKLELLQAESPERTGKSMRTALPILLNSPPPTRVESPGFEGSPVISPERAPGIRSTKPASTTSHSNSSSHRSVSSQDNGQLSSLHGYNIDNSSNCSYHSNSATKSRNSQGKLEPLLKRSQKHNPQADKYVNYVPPPVEAPTYKSKEERRQAARELHERRKDLRAKSLSPKSVHQRVVHQHERISPLKESSCQSPALPNIHLKSNVSASDYEPKNTRLIDINSEYDYLSSHDINQREFYDESRMKHIRDKQYKYADYKPPQPELKCHTKEDIHEAARDLHEHLTHRRKGMFKAPSQRRKKWEQQVKENGNALDNSLPSSQRQLVI